MPLIRNIHTVAETQSTNDDVAALAREGWPEGTWLRAGRQTGGKGRLGRQSAVGVHLDLQFARQRLEELGQRSLLQERLMKLRASYEADPAAAKQLASSGEKPRDEKLSPIEHAAWAGLCLMLLNLDEALTKN